MPLDMPDGTACFVDANIFYYSLVSVSDRSPVCLALFERAIRKRITIFASFGVLGDALHKVMLSEVAEVTRRERSGLVGYLKKHPDIISQLVEYPKALEWISRIPIELLPVDHIVLRDAVAISKELGLLTNDSIIVALMRHHRLTHLATNDGDFERVGGITVWKPQ